MRTFSSLPLSPRPPASGLLLVLPIPFSGGDERPRDSPEILPREGLLFSARPQREVSISPGQGGGSLGTYLGIPARALLPFMVPAPRPREGPTEGSSAAVRPVLESVGPERAPIAALRAARGSGARAGSHAGAPAAEAARRGEGPRGRRLGAPRPAAHPAASLPLEAAEGCGRPRPRAPPLPPPARPRALPPRHSLGPVPDQLPCSFQNCRGWASLCRLGSRRPARPPGVPSAEQGPSPTSRPPCPPSLRWGAGVRREASSRAMARAVGAAWWLGALDLFFIHLRDGGTGRVRMLSPYRSPPPPPFA